MNNKKDELDISKLETIPVNLSKISYVLKNYDDKKTIMS